MNSVKRLLAAVLLIVLGVGCSEKQKEAARLEAAMKNGDSVVTEVVPDTAALTTSGQFDSAVAQISAQISGGEGKQLPDSRIIDTLPIQSELNVAIDSGIRSADTELSATPTESTELVMDAGAIPQEELPKSSPQMKAAPAVNTEEAPSGSGFVVQVVSTPDESEATMLVAKFVKGGYRAFKTMAVVEGTTYYRVRVGRYDSVTEAEATLTELHEKYKVNGFVTSVR